MAELSLTALLRERACRHGDATAYTRTYGHDFERLDGPR